MLATVEFENENQILSSSSSGGLDMENYYKIDNGLKTKPIFGYTNLFEKINIGDIYYEEKTTANIGHLAIVTGIKYDNYYESYYIELIENAKKYNVCYGMLDDYRFQKRVGSILRVKDITYSQIDTVINYLKTQLGEEYNSLTNNCVSLVNRAFKKAVYDLFSDEIIITPVAITRSRYVKKIQMGNHSCFNFSNFMKYKLINDDYHKTICYCGESVLQEHVATTGNNGKRYCKYCFLILDNGPGFDVPFSMKRKILAIKFNMVQISALRENKEQINLNE